MNPEKTIVSIVGALLFQNCAHYTVALRNEVKVNATYSFAIPANEKYYRLCKYLYTDSITAWKPFSHYEVLSDPLDSAWYNDSVVILFSEKKKIKYGIKTVSYLKLKQIDTGERRNYAIFNPAFNK